MREYWLFYSFGEGAEQLFTSQYKISYAQLLNNL